MKKILLMVTALAISAAMFAQKNPKAPAKTNVNLSAMSFKSLLDSFSYAAGVNVARSMKEQGINGLNVAIMKKAIEDVFGDKPVQLNDEQVNACIQRQLDIFTKEKMAAEKARGIAFLEENKKKPGVVVLPDGLQYQVVVKGDSTANKPKAADTVVVNYVGTFVDGKEFDNSVKRGQPAIFPVGGVIKGWTEILQMMPVGSRWKVFIPSELAYGEGGAGGGAIPPNAALIFEISLEGIKPAAAPPKE